MYYFIVNPISGCGRGKLVWKTVEQELTQLCIEYKAFLLRYKGEAREIAASLSELHHPFTLVAVGGDGTLNEIINGLSTYEYVTLGCIPTGSGNDFVRGLKLPHDPITALHRILQPAHILPIKIGAVTAASDHRQASFCVSSGIGFDAAVCNGAYHSRLKELLNLIHAGKLVYAGTALKQLIFSRLAPMKLTLDEKNTFTFRKAFFAAAMNLPYEGGGFWFAPQANPASDCFTLCAAEGISKPRILSILPLAFFGKHVGKHGVHLLECKKAVIHTQMPLCVHTDGEIFGFYDTITFEAQPERLRVIVS